MSFEASEILDDLACPVDFMRFTLTYDGPLHSGTSPEEKNDIRRKLHPELEDIWLTHPAIRDWYADWKQLSQTEKYQNHPDRVLFASRVGQFSFIPLVSTKHHLICELDILFLRREEPGALVSGGDLDNRLKPLFDALRMPSQTSELVGLGASEPDPFFTLLEDDRLIASLNPRTSRLDGPLVQSASQKDGRLVIDVTVQVTRLTVSNIGLGG
jgi:hypothetical protein